MVELDAGTDLGANGLVLTNNGSSIFHDDDNNSPANVTIDGGGRTVDLTGTAQGSLITVKAGVTLTLKNITFKGLNPTDDNGANNTVNLIDVNGGTLILEDGAVISDNQSTAHYAGGVYVTSGELIMNGGAISNNKANSGGGGVCVYPGAKFTMSGGAISGNTCTEYGYGVGVLVGSGGEFIMSGGAISNNIYNGNKNYGSGGGVLVQGGTFTMSGGAISGNSTSLPGGGVGVEANGVFIMEGGTISGNTAATYGGGVGVASGTFTKTGGGIINGDDDTTHNPGDTENTSLSGQGHAAWVNTGSKKRDTTAGTGVDLDSTKIAPDGGWEP
jgi:hypothetical protein